MMHARSTKMAAFMAAAGMLFLCASFSYNLHELRMLVGSASAQLPPGAGINISSITLSNNKPTSGDNVVITATIVNANPVPIQNATASFIAGQKIVDNVTFSLPASGTGNASANWTASTAALTITVIIYVNALPATSRTIGVNVTGKPVGDVFLPSVALLAVFATIFIALVVPSVLSKLRMM